MKIFDLLDHLESGGKVSRLGKPDIQVYWSDSDNSFKFIWLGDKYRTAREWSLGIPELMCDDWVKLERRV